MKFHCELHSKISINFLSVSYIIKYDCPLMYLMYRKKSYRTTGSDLFWTPDPNPTWKFLLSQYIYIENIRISWKSIILCFPILSRNINWVKHRWLILFRYGFGCKTLVLCVHLWVSVGYKVRLGGQGLDHGHQRKQWAVDKLRLLIPNIGDQ